MVVAEQEVQAPSRRRLQFNLKTLLVVMTVGGATAGLLLLQMKNAERFRRERARIEQQCRAKGLEVHVNSDLQVDRVQFSGKAKDLAAVRLFPSLEEVTLHPFGVREAWIDLAPLASIPHLRKLELGTVGIGDDDLAHIAGLTELEELELCYSKVTDRGLRHLRSLRNLRFLWLQGTAVTDAGVDDLLHLKNLRLLEVPSGVTKNGRARLRAGLPHLSDLRPNK